MDSRPINMYYSAERTSDRNVNVYRNINTGHRNSNHENLRDSRITVTNTTRNTTRNPIRNTNT